MATKRFDDATEKARALEAKAKKVRREAQAARTKAYADALVTVFPEVKDICTTTPRWTSFPRFSKTVS